MTATLQGRAPVGDEFTIALQARMLEEQLVEIERLKRENAELRKRLEERK